MLARAPSAIDLIRVALVGASLLGAFVTLVEIEAGAATPYLVVAAFLIGALVTASTWVVPVVRKHSVVTLIVTTYLVSGFDVAQSILIPTDLTVAWVITSSVGGAIIVGSLVRRAMWMVPYFVFQAIIIAVTSSAVWDSSRFIAVSGSIVALGLLITALTYARASAERRNEVSLRHLKEREAELVQALRQAEAAGRAKSAFLAAMSHEFRTPLTAIISSADVISGDLEDARRGGPIDLGDVLNMVSMIERGGERLLRTMESVLELSSIEDGDTASVDEEIQVAAEVCRIVSALEGQAMRKNLRLHLDLSESPATMQGDLRAFRQIVHHLVHNAIVYTPAGRVNVEIRVREDSVEIDVADTGVGIEEEHLETVFEPFRQASEGHNRMYEGAGLGLSLVRHYTRCLRGDIEVDSTPGLGSRFIVRVPHRLECRGLSTEEVMEPTTHHLAQLNVVANDRLTLDQLLA